MQAELISPHATAGDSFKPVTKIVPTPLPRIWLFLVTLFASFIAHAESLAPEEIYQKVLPSVMTLHVENALGQTFVGSAFLALDKNIAVTAWHVINDATNVIASFSDGENVQIDGIIDHDEAHDLALIRVKSGSRPVSHLSILTPLVGSRAYAIGAPKGYEFSITDGLLSQIQSIHNYPQYQVSCPISGGNSGGPIINDHGDVIGITAWTKKDAQNLNFAIPAEFLTHMQLTHPLISWDSLARQMGQTIPNDPPLPAAATVKSPADNQNAAELKRLLKVSAGKKLKIIVADGDHESRFEVVVPRDFVK